MACLSNNMSKPKKNKKKLFKVITLASAFAILGSIGIASTTYAVDNLDVWSLLNDEQKQQLEEHHQEMKAERENMKTAIEEGDYQAWKQIVDSKPKITDYVTEDNFARFSEMHKLMQDGDFEGAQEIRDEIGIPSNLGPGPGMMKTMGDNKAGFGPGSGMKHGAGKHQGSGQYQQHFNN